MKQAKSGDTVAVHYTGRLDDGTVFDSSEDQEPLEFTLGQDQVIAGFEKAVFGMSAGESKTITIPAEQAYGPYQEELHMTLGRDQFPPHLNPQIGQRLEGRQPDGQTFIVIVTSVSDAAITIDANPPLAGKDLTFDIQLVELIN